MIVVAHVVLLLVGVEAVIRGLVEAAPLEAPGQLCFFSFPLLTLSHVKIINRLVFNDFLFLKLCQVVIEGFESVLRIHRELK